MKCLTDHLMPDSEPTRMTGQHGANISNNWQRHRQGCSSQWGLDPVTSSRSFYPASEWATAGTESIARLASLRDSGHHEHREDGRREEFYRGGDWITAGRRGRLAASPDARPDRFLDAASLIAQSS